MITMQDFMETVGYRITEGSDYCWNCYGPNAYSLDSWNGDQDGHSVGIVFDTKTQVVYEVSACDYKNNRAYRLIHPDYREKNRAEAKERSVDETQAWDDVNYTDLETEEDMLEKARAIVNGEEYDTRVSIPLDLPKDELFDIMTRAHERDMTLNQYIEEALRYAIEEFNSNPEGFKTRANRWKDERDVT